jgi:signal transduction histidine kinase
MVLAPAFLAAALGIGYVYTEEQQAYRQSLRETTRALSLVLDKEIVRREGVLRTLAASPALDAADFATFYRHAQALASTWDTTIFLSDISGQQLLNTRLPLGTKNLPKSLPLMTLRKTSEADAMVVSDVYFAPVGKSYSFAVQIPVKRDDRLLYYIGMGSFTSQLQSVFEEQKLPAAWIGTIVDRNGMVVARSHDPVKFVGTHVKKDFAKVLAADKEGFYEGTTLNGVPVTAFFSRAPQSEWRFIVNVPQSLLQRTATHATAFIGSLSLLLLTCALLGALWVARHTARPIEALRLSALRLGSGEPFTAISSGITEMDAVSVAMVRAGSEIRDARVELERRVAEAVAVAERSHQALQQGQKLEALGRLTGGIAHDFNNVLQTLTTGLQIAELYSTDTRVKLPLEACQRAIDRATELTRQLMVFGRIQDARLETIDLHRQLMAMTPLLKGGLSSDISFKLNIEDKVWPVTLDPLQFELALLNLTINARDAMPRGGHLQIEIRNETVTHPAGEMKAGDYVRIAVIDSG